MVLQLTPDGSYEINTSTGSPVLRTIALASVGLTSQPPFDWHTAQENWFSPKSANLASLLGGAAKLLFKLAHRSATAAPDQVIQATADQLATTSSHTFQLYAQAVLTPNSWIQGAPSYGSQAYYFEQKSPPDPNTAIRMLFDITPGTPTRMAKLSWLTLDTSVSVYFNGVPDGTTYTLEPKPLTSMPTNGWYYQAVHP